MLKVFALFLVLFVAACTPKEDTTIDTGNGTIDLNDKVNFPDPVLRACVETLTGKNPGDPIYGYDVADITKVQCDGVSNISGMEYFVQVELAQFFKSNIGTLKSLAGLENIKYLWIRGGGSVTTLDEIKNLKSLLGLEYQQSQLNDISAISNMTSLKTVDLRENKLTNISALSSLPNIETIRVINTPTLTTLGVQFTAPKLTEINVGNCGLTSLNELSGLPELTTIIAGDNYLTDVSFITILPKLDGIGIDGNCLSENAMQTYVDWYNARHETQKTVAEEMQYQNPDNKCQ